MLFLVCEFPLPNSLVQIMVVWSNIEPSAPGSGVSLNRFASKATCSQYHVLILMSFS